MNEQTPLIHKTDDQCDDDLSSRSSHQKKRKILIAFIVLAAYVSSVIYRGYNKPAAPANSIADIVPDEGNMFCPCEEPHLICQKVGKSVKNKKRCEKGKEISEKCRNNQDCFSGACEKDLRICNCPTFENCVGCKDTTVPCIRVEQWNYQEYEVCDLKALLPNSKDSKSETKMTKLQTFDLGAKNNQFFTKNENFLWSLDDKCFSVDPVNNDNNELVPPFAVQASVAVEDIEQIGQIAVYGRGETLLGSQIFLDGHWISHISRNDVIRRSTKNSRRSLQSKSPKKSKSYVKVVKDIYPRVHIQSDSFADLRNTTFLNEMAGKTVVVHLSPGEFQLDFDLIKGSAVDFIGQGTNLTAISIIGSINVFGRARFNNMSISFQSGSMNIVKSVIFESCQLVGLERCPYSFQETNNEECIFVSPGIDQADDAALLCENYSTRASLAGAESATSFLEENREALPRSALAWIRPLDSKCTSINASGAVNDTQHQDCEKYIRVICSAPVKHTLLGTKYTSFESDHFVGTYPQDLYKRIVDKARLPFQLRGTLSFYQHDLADGVLFTVPDAFPKALSVNISLKSGSETNVQVGLDTSNSTQSGSYLWELSDEVVSLPSKIHLHANASVCIEKVDLLVRNATDHQFIVASIPIHMLADCIDYNVCTSDDERVCGRSLMYYDEDFKCARLETNNPSIPRDLSLDLLALKCSRLTTWHHPYLGSPFQIEASFSEQSKSVHLKKTTGDDHSYDFNETNQVYNLDQSTVLPVDFRVEGVGLLHAVKITRYGLVISDVVFERLWNCINICSALATPESLLLQPRRANGAILDLIAAPECKKVPYVSTDLGDDGRETCTGPPIEVSSFEDVIQGIESILLSNSTHRTLNCNVTGRILDFGEISVPPNRGVIFFGDIDINDDALKSIENGTIYVSDFSELYLVDLQLNGTLSIQGSDQAEIDISGCGISTEATIPFLRNEGSASLNDVDLFFNTTLLNVDAGDIDLTFVNFHDDATFINSMEGTILISHLLVYDEFLPFLSALESESLDKSSLELPDAKRRYRTIDDEDDIACFGNDEPHKVITDITIQECQDACENEFLCSGVITSVKSTTENKLRTGPSFGFQQQCGLCLQEDNCSFNCSSYDGGAYFKASSNFDYSKVMACPYVSRTFKTFSNITLEECKLFCTYYTSCEGFTIVNESKNSAAKTCELIGDLDFADDCGGDESKFVYIPFIPDSTNGYHHVHGRLTNPNPIANHPNIPVDECSHVCTKTISCSSFQVLNNTCALFKDNQIIRTNLKEGLYISIDDNFPKKRYMAYQSCYIPGSYDSFNIKTVKRCRGLCNEDLSCVGFAFRPIFSLFEDNCELYDSVSMINGVFGPELGCQIQPPRREARNVFSRRLKSKKTKTNHPSFHPSSPPSIQPTMTMSPSVSPSSIPSRSPNPTSEPSENPSKSHQPSFVPSLSPSINPTLTMSPSGAPSISIRPSQVSENYDLFVAYATDTFRPLETIKRAFTAIKTIPGLIEDECKDLCYKDIACIAIKYDSQTFICQIGELSDVLSERPSSVPSTFPSLHPSMEPTSAPSISSKPSNFPSNIPSTSPSSKPSIDPSHEPSISNNPSDVPSNSPSTSSSKIPSTSNNSSLNPTLSSAPSIFPASGSKTNGTPSLSPSNIPSFIRSPSMVPTFEQPPLVLKSVQVDLGARYASVNACYIGERLRELEDEIVVVEKAEGYFRMPRTCTHFPPISEGTVVKSPSECGLECSNQEKCIGFIYYTDYQGESNSEKIGMCDAISSFRLGECEGVEMNADLYLRADVGATCQSACNVHQLCSAFIFDQNLCELYSDIAVLNECPEGQTPHQINIGLSYRERDALVSTPGHTLVDYENLRSLGCREFSFERNITEKSNDTGMTPLFCQEHCNAHKKDFYAVYNGTMCSCGSDEFSELLKTPNNCTLPCPGDPSQNCGGYSFAQIGKTGVPLLGLTLSQCKKECFYSDTCEAILFRENSGAVSKCELHSTGEFDKCTTISCDSEVLYVESLEHYYSEPRTSYIGSKSLYIATVTLLQDCQKICDAFRPCEAIRFDEVPNVLNCELLGGEMVKLREENITDNVEVARDVTLYTMGFSPDLQEQIASFSTTFDLDECRTLCDQHVLCGSIVFISPTCKLYRKDAFADVSHGSDSLTPHYISYSYFVDPGQEFALARGLCVDKSHNNTVLLDSRLTTLSINDCAARCNSLRQCAVFEFDKASQSCQLYSETTPFTSFGCMDAEAFIMFTRGKFVLKENACLKNEISLTKKFEFDMKSPFECAALCDKWFNCRSFRVDEDTGLCQLFESEQYGLDTCILAPALSAKLYVYYSDFRFTRLDSSFCVGGSPITTIDNAPIEACKGICDKLEDCLSFQHTQAGLCVLYASADFSVECSGSDDNRDLYITYKDVVDPKSRYLFNELDNCFDLKIEDDENQILVNEDKCQTLCEQSSECFGIQVDNSETNSTCFLLQGGTLPNVLNDCNDKKTLLKTKINPYKKLSNTCLQRKIEFISLILDKEEYECMALCNAHPFCRYFLYGNDSSSEDPQLRECILFEAQARELDDCEDDGRFLDFKKDYKGLSAFVNGRTFIDQVTWFGEPEVNFATISGITYQECASLCDSIEDCKAFIHTWNYRRAPLGTSRPLLFTKTRLTRLDFEFGNNEALFVQFDTNENRLVLGPANSDDDVRNQYVVPELTGSGTFKLKFWSSSGLCLSGRSPPAKFENNNGILKMTRDYFDNEDLIPMCQKLGISDCESTGVIEFKDFSENNFGAPIKLAYENQDGNGCIRFQRNFGDDIDIKLSPPRETNCTSPPIDTYETCERTTITSYKNHTVGERDSKIVSDTCPSSISDKLDCTKSPSSYVPNRYAVSTTTEICQYPPESDCATNTTQVLEDITEKSVCKVSILYQETTCWEYTSEAVLQEIYNFFGNAPECQYQGSDVENQIFSSSFSGRSCDFDEQIATFPSEEFTFASDAVILQNDASANCLSKDLTLVSCHDEEIAQWVYLFSYGHLYYTDRDNTMQCLTRIGNNILLKTEECESNNEYQMWNYNGDFGTFSPLDTLPNSNNTNCIVVNNNVGRIEVGDCSDPTSRWIRFETCKLNTREKTTEMSLEKIQERGRCINSDEESDLGDCNSGSVARWRYIYDGDDPRLQYTGPEASEIDVGGSTFVPLCLGRRAGSGKVEDFKLIEGKEDIIKLPTGLVPKVDDTIVFRRLSLAGEENNVFQWSLIDSKSGFPIEPFYCLDIPQSEQKECPPPPTLSSAISWRKYGNEGDATEISVLPSATLQTVSDPEVLFQFYLFSAEGKASRYLRSRMAGLVRDVERTKEVIAKVSRTISEALSFLAMINIPLDQLDDGLKDGSFGFKLLSKIILGLEQIPKAGKVVKKTKLKKITKEIGKIMEKGSKNVKKVEKKMDKAYDPIRRFRSIVGSVLSAFEIISQVDVFVDAITRSSFCAYREGNIVYYEATQQIINILAGKVKFSVGLIDGIQKFLAVLDRFKSTLKELLLTPIKVFQAIVQSLSYVVIGLQYLKTIVNFNIFLPLPKFKGIRICLIFFCFTLPFFSFGDVNFDMLDIAGILDGLQSIFGWTPIFFVVKLAEELIFIALEALFKAIGIPFPNFEFKIPILDELKDLVEEAFRKFNELIDYFDNILDLPGLDNLIEPFVESITNSIPSFDIPGCENTTDIGACFLDVVGLDIPTPIELDDLGLPKVSIGELPFGIPDEMVEIVKGVYEEIPAVFYDVKDLFTKDIACGRYETRRVNIPKLIGDNFNISTKDFPFPDCPINIKICTDLRLPGLDTFLGNFNSRLNGITNTGTSRRLSQEPSCPDWNGGINIDLPVGDLVDKIPFDKIMKLNQMSRKKILKSFDYEKLKTFGVGQMANFTFTSIVLELDIGLPRDFSLRIGCNDGQFEALLNIGSLMKFTVGVKGLPKPTPQAEQVIRYLDQDNKKSQETRQRFLDEFRAVEKITEILCYVDYLVVLRRSYEILKQGGRNYFDELTYNQLREFSECDDIGDYSFLMINTNDFMDVCRDELYEKYLDKFNGYEEMATLIRQNFKDMWIVLETAYSDYEMIQFKANKNNFVPETLIKYIQQKYISIEKLDDLKFDLKFFVKKSGDGKEFGNLQRDFTKLLFSKFEEGSISSAEMPAWRNPKECNRLYAYGLELPSSSGSFIQNLKDSFKFGNIADFVKGISFHIASFGSLGGPNIGVSKTQRTIGRQFKDKLDGNKFDPLWFAISLVLNRGIQFVDRIYGAINNCNTKGLLDLIPRVKVSWIYDLIGWVTNGGKKFEKDEQQGKEYTLLDAMLPKSLEGSGNKDIIYVEQDIIEFPFWIGSMSINLVRDENTTDTFAYRVGEGFTYCISRVCFYGTNQDAGRIYFNQASNNFGGDNLCPQPKPTTSPSDDTLSPSKSTAPTTSPSDDTLSPSKAIAILP